MWKTPLKNVIKHIILIVIILCKQILCKQILHNNGWQCPICKRILAPFVQECPCKGQGIATMTVANTELKGADNIE